MFPNRSYPYLYYTVTPLFFLVHMQSRHTVSDVYKDPCVAVESSVRLQPTCSYHLSLRIGKPDCCAFTCCTTLSDPNRKKGMQTLSRSMGQRSILKRLYFSSYNKVSVRWHL